MFPNQIIVNVGYFTVNKRTTLFIPDIQNLKSAVDFFNARFRNSDGFELQISSKEPSQNFIAIEVDSLSGQGNEAYTLKVTDKGATIKAASNRGAFYGLISILQLLPPEIESTAKISDIEWNIPCVDINWL